MSNNEKPQPVPGFPTAAQLEREAKVAKREGRTKLERLAKQFEKPKRKRGR